MAPGGHVLIHQHAHAQEEVSARRRVSKLRDALSKDGLKKKYLVFFFSLSLYLGREAKLGDKLK